MATYDTRSFSPTFLGLATQLGISTSISLYCLLQFEWNRRKKSMQYLYTPRVRLAKNPSPPIPSGLFSWIRATIFLNDEFYLRNVGLDALMYIRFLKMAFQFLLFNVIIVGPILIPINYTAASNRDDGVSVLAVSNIPTENTNILCAHVICTYIVSISWMYLSYRNYYDYMNLHRQHLLNKVLDGSIAERTVMISRIPRDLRSEDKLQEFVSKLGLGEVESARMVRFTGKLDRKISRRENVLLLLENAHIQLAKNVYNGIKRRRLLGTGIWARLFGYTSDPPSLALETSEAREHQRIQDLVDRLGPRKRRRTNISEGTSENNANINNHSKFSTSGTFASNDLMDHEDGYGRQFQIWNALRRISKDTLDKYQPTHRIGFLGNKVVAIDHFLKKFNYLDRRIAELRSISTQERPYKATSTGFVTFKDHISAQLCAQSIMSSKPHTCTTRMAPEPRDILWDNLRMKFKVKLIRSIVVNACVWALIIFWLFPIVFILGLTSIDSLSEKISFLKQFLETPIIKALLQNVLPTVLVTFFMAILPWILMELSKLESFPSYSELEEAVLIRYYHFSFFNVLIVFLLGYTFLQSIFDVIKTPTSILEVLAESFPRGATFFINYIIFNTCTHGLELVQVGSQLFLHIILTSRFISTTPRMLQHVTHPWSFQFYYYYPNHILILVITIIFSVINPLILVFSLVYYGFALVVFKHQFAYCYVRRYEAGGKFYRPVFRYTTDGLIIFQLTMIGTIWLRRGIVVGAALIPLLIGACYFKYYCHKTFYSRTHYLALDSRLSLQNNFQNEQINQSVNTNENGKTTKENVSPEFSYSKKENVGTDTEVKGKTAAIDLSSIVNGAEKEGDYDTNSETSTKIASTKNNIIINESDVNESQNEKDINSKKLQSSLELIRFSTEKLCSSSEKIHNVQKPDLSQSVIMSNEKDDENVDDSKIIHPSSVTTNGKFEAFITLSGSNAYNSSNNNIPIITPKVTGSTNNDNIPSSSRTQKKHKLTIVPPEGGKNILNTQITASPVENVDGHAPRLPSGGILRSSHPAHFTHDPNFKVLQDETSTYQTYTHPNLVKALNRKLWLPRNPLKKICLEDNVELSRSLTSSEGGPGIVGYWGDASQYLGEAKVGVYGNHEFPSKLVHPRAATNEGDEGNQDTRQPPAGLFQDTDSEGDNESEWSYCGPEEENIVSLNEFGSGELVSGELTSGEEF